MELNFNFNNEYLWLKQRIFFKEKINPILKIFI